MEDRYICAILAVLISNHAYGTPMDKDSVVNRAAVSDKGKAKDAFEVVQIEPFVRHNPNRGMLLNSSRFGELADFLYYNCEWEPFVIKSRLKHYEGWKNHDWA